MINLINRAFNYIKKIIKRKILPIKSDWLKRTEPFSKKFGLDRGQAIDRKFIYDFLASHKSDIEKKVIEIGDDKYTYELGKKLSKTVILAGSGNSTRSTEYTHPETDLQIHSTLDELGKFNCVIATNVLNFIYDTRLSIQGLAKIVEPSNGVVLATVAGLVQISRYDYDRWGDYWRFSDMSIRRLFEEYFYDVEIKTYGNAPLASAFIMGLSQEEIPVKLFNYSDPDYQILIGIRASNPK